MDWRSPETRMQEIRNVYRIWGRRLSEPWLVDYSPFDIFCKEGFARLFFGSHPLGPSIFRGRTSVFICELSMYSTACSYTLPGFSLSISIRHRKGLLKNIPGFYPGFIIADYVIVKSGLPCKNLNALVFRFQMFIVLCTTG